MEDARNRVAEVDLGRNRLMLLGQRVDLDTEPLGPILGQTLLLAPDPSYSEARRLLCPTTPEQYLFNSTQTTIFCLLCVIKSRSKESNSSVKDVHMHE